MRRGLVVGAAFGTAVAALVVIAVVAARDPGASRDVAREPGVTRGPAAAEAPQPSTSMVQTADAQLVREGDTVEASGRVIAVPGQPVKFCAPAPEALAGRPGPPDCHVWIEARGVDLDALTGREEIDGAVVGRALLRGTWHDRVLTVTSQAAPAEPTPPALPEFGPAPCDPPPGGWLPESSFNGRAVHDYIEQRPGRFAAPWIAWPDGPPGPDTAAPGALSKPSVLVIEVINGDVDQARAELGRIYSGNLCVTLAAPGVRPSGEVQRDAKAIMDRLSPLMNDRRNGIYSAGDDPSGRVSIDFLVLDQQLYDAFTNFGLDQLILNPWIRPA